MKKSNLIKLFLVLLISVIVMTFNTMVMAADEIDLTTTLKSNNTTSNNTSNNNTNNTNTNNTNTNNTNTNNTSNVNSSSIYNNTNLPHTGIEDSVPAVALIVVFGISAIYAYKKIKDYRNI